LVDADVTAINIAACCAANMGSGYPWARLNSAVYWHACRQLVVSLQGQMWSRWLMFWWHWIAITTPCFSHVSKPSLHETAFPQHALYEMTNSSSHGRFSR